MAERGEFGNTSARSYLPVRNVLPTENTLSPGAKLAGALNGIAQDRGLANPAFTVACLKRALDHLHKSQAGLEAVAPKKLLPEKKII